MAAGTRSRALRGRLEVTRGGPDWALHMDAADNPPASLPDDLPILERSAVRVVVLDAADTSLLFHTHDADHRPPACGCVCV